MLKVFNPSPVQVGSIECLQSAQNWQRKSLSLQGLNLLQSVLIKLTTGKISITTSFRGVYYGIRANVNIFS